MARALCDYFLHELAVLHREAIVIELRIPGIRKQDAKLADEACSGCDMSSATYVSDH